MPYGVFSRSTQCFTHPIHFSTQRCPRVSTPWIQSRLPVHIRIFTHVKQSLRPIHPATHQSMNMTSDVDENLLSRVRLHSSPPLSSPLFPAIHSRIPIFTPSSSPAHPSFTLAFPHSILASTEKLHLPNDTITISRVWIHIQNCPQNLH